jgi:hypothetical protein
LTGHALGWCTLPVGSNAIAGGKSAAADFFDLELHQMLSVAQMICEFRGFIKERGVLSHWTWRPPAFAYNFFASSFGSENFATPAPLPSPRDCCSPRYYLLGAYDYLEESVDYHI